FTHVELDEVGKAQRSEPGSGFTGKTGVPNRVVDHAAPVLPNRAGKPGCRIAEPGAKLEDRASPDQARDKVAEIAGGGADNGKRGSPGLRLHSLELRNSRRDQRVEIPGNLG